jgi:hypothetical protein
MVVVGHLHIRYENQRGRVNFSAPVSSYVKAEILGVLDLLAWMLPGLIRQKQSLMRTKHGHEVPPRACSDACRSHAYDFGAIYAPA